MGREVRKVPLFVVLAAVLIGALALPAAAAELTVEIFGAWRSENWRHIGQWLDGIAEEYERKYPGVTVNYVASNGVEGLILAAASGMSSPDVAIASVQWARDAFDRGLLRPLNEYWERSPVGDLNFFPSARIFNQKDGVIYGAPWSMEAYTIAYNADLFEQAGLPIHPDAIGSWDEFLAAARRLHRVDDAGNVVVGGIGIGLSFQQFASWLYANGGQFYTADYSAVAFDSPQGRETIEFLAGLLVHQRVTGAGGLANFHAGRVAMTAHQLPAGAMLAEAPFRALQTDMPPGPSGTQRSTATWSNMFTITTMSRQPDLGWAWIELMLSLEQQEKLVEGFGYPVSAYREAYSSPVFIDALRRHPYIENTPRILQSAGVWPFLGLPEVLRQGTAQQLLTAIARGEAEPVSTLGEIARLYNLAMQQ